MGLSSEPCLKPIRRASSVHSGTALGKAWLSLLGLRPRGLGEGPKMQHSQKWFAPRVWKTKKNLTIFKSLAHRNRSDVCDLRLRCPSRTPEIARFPGQEKAMLHCDLRLRWKDASDLRFRAAISEPKTPSFCGISGDLAPSTRKSLAIAIV